MFNLLILKVMYRFKLTAKQDMYQGKIKKGMIVYVVQEAATNPDCKAIQNGWKNIGVDVPQTCCQIGQYIMEREFVRK